jgi:hypothetical protein
MTMMAATVCEMKFAKSQLNSEKPASTTHRLWLSRMLANYAKSVSHLRLGRKKKKKTRGKEEVK